MEYYLTVKKNYITNFVDKWMEMEKIIASEVTQTPKDKHLRSLLEAPSFEYSDVST